MLSGRPSGAPEDADDVVSLEVGYGRSGERGLWKTVTIEAGEGPGDVVRLAFSGYRIDAD